MLKKGLKSTFVRMGLPISSIILSFFCATGGFAAEKTTVYVQNYFPEWGDTWTMNRLCWKFMRNHPGVVIRKRGSASTLVPGSGKILAFAGNTAPDVLLEHFWTIQNDIEQGFPCPLNEFVGYDGFYGLDVETGERTERTGTPKLRRLPDGSLVRDANGVIDDDEALWNGWLRCPPIMRIVSCRPGKLDKGPDGIPYEGPVVYGIAAGLPTYYGIAYRKDLFEKAGLTEKDIPRTWDEFWRVCQRLTNPKAVVSGAKYQRGRRAFLLPLAAWQWLMWLYSAGGDSIRQYRTNPKTGKEVSFSMEETRFIDPETGDSLVNQPSRWRAVFSNQGGRDSLDFFHKLCWEKWIVNPATGDPVDLTEEDVKRGWIVDPTTKKRISFDASKDVFTGVVRHAGDAADDGGEMFRRGEVAMIMTDLSRLEKARVPAANLGFFAVPGKSGFPPVVGRFEHFKSLNHALSGEKNRKKRQTAWDIASFLVSPEATVDVIESKVFNGFAPFLTPDQLRFAGREEYLEQIPDYWRKNFKKVTANARTEPYIGAWGPVQLQLQRKVLSLLATDKGIDYKKALAAVEKEANEQLMFGLPEEIRRRYRPWAWLLVAVAGSLFVFGMVMIIRSHLPKKGDGGVTTAPGARGVFSKVAPLLMLAPAALSILLWSYYPLFRGSAMAFQNVSIVGGSEWIGVDNFINVFCMPQFYIYLGKTFKYVALSLGLSFLTPIITALLLSEVPRFKALYRVVYFLPQISSGLVILFVWKLLYNPTEYGMLNQLLLGLNTLPLVVVVALKLSLLALVVFVVFIVLKYLITCRAADSLFARTLRFGVAACAALVFCWLLATGSVPSMFHWCFEKFAFQAQNFLGDKRWAMIAIILPGVWAQAGMGSLIYLAALKSVDEDAYEAAEIDGCSMIDKMLFITVPYLKPLIIINFIGAFIATFHTMGNIFAMTGGGPGDETMVLSLAIWYEAFSFMRMGTATAMAWTLGLMLIGFTVYQLRILKKVDFRRAQAE